MIQTGNVTGPDLGSQIRTCVIIWTTQSNGTFNLSIRDTPVHIYIGGVQMAASPLDVTFDFDPGFKT